MIIRSLPGSVLRHVKNIAGIDTTKLPRWIPKDVPGRKWMDQWWSDQWVVSPTYKQARYIGVITSLQYILSFDPNFQRDIQVVEKSPRFLYNPPMSPPTETHGRMWSFARVKRPIPWASFIMEASFTSSLVDGKGLGGNGQRVNLLALGVVMSHWPLGLSMMTRQIQPKIP